MKKIPCPTDPVWEYPGNYSLQGIVKGLSGFLDARVACLIEGGSEWASELDQLSHEFEVVDPPEISRGGLQAEGKHYWITGDFLSQLHGLIEMFDLQYVNGLVVYDKKILLEAYALPFNRFYASADLTEIQLETLNKSLAVSPVLTNDVYGP